MRRGIRGFLVMFATLGVCAPVAQASLGVPGQPVAFPSLPAFEAAAGGADNGTVAGEQGGGFRHATWDDVKVDGSEPGSTVIQSGHVVAPARSRLQPWGMALGPDIAVANDGFRSVNSSAPNTRFSAPNVWSPFNSNTAELDVVVPDGAAATPVPAQTRGLGIEFVNVTNTNQTKIQYYDGDILLGEADAPANPGGPSFAGLLFPNPVVTRVVVTLGSGAIFDVTNGTPSPVLSTSDPVTGDDVVLAEPAPARPPVAATAGVPVSSVLDTFTESTVGAKVRATIDWGDGTVTAGTIAPAAGGSFAVTGDHPYAQAGSYTARVTVEDFEGPDQTSQTSIQVAPRATTTNLACSPSPVAVTATTSCVATVSDAAGPGATTPTGVLAFSTTTPGATFAQDTGCLLGPSAVAGVASCAVQFTPGALPPSQAHVAVAYGGDAAHAASGAIATVGVRPQRCSLRTLTRKLRPRGLAVLVTCDARANVQIGVRAVAARQGRVAPFQLQFGTLRQSVTAGRPTVLTIKPDAGVLRSLRAALRRGQHVSLRLTLTASSHGTSKTTTTRVAAIRVG